LGKETILPVADPGPEVPHRTEQRAVVLQLERLMDYPMVRRRVEQHNLSLLSLHGSHYVFDVRGRRFIPSSESAHRGTGPYADAPADDGQPTALPHAL
jgi:carbonic anhydrase